MYHNLHKPKSEEAYELIATQLREEQYEILKDITMLTQNNSLLEQMIEPEDGCPPWTNLKQEVISFFTPRKHKLTPKLKLVNLEEEEEED